MLAVRARILIATLWAGSLWTVGYLVAPTLFATLSDSMLAGTIAGKLFRIEAWISVASSVALILLVQVGVNEARNETSTKVRRHVTWLALGMLVCTLIGFFALQPFMSALRDAAAAAGGVMDPEARAHFGILHGVSSTFYLVQSLLAIALVLKIR